ncbi:MAG: hypothetical protein ABWZ64_01450 [Xanthobacteraceae bacterium]
MFFALREQLVGSGDRVDVIVHAVTTMRLRRTRPCRLCALPEPHQFSSRSEAETGERSRRAQGPWRRHPTAARVRNEGGGNLSPADRHQCRHDTRGPRSHDVARNGSSLTLTKGSCCADTLNRPKKVGQTRHLRKAMEGLIALTDAELAAVAGGESLSVYIFNESFNNVTDSLLIFGSELLNSLNTNSYNTDSFNIGAYNTGWSYLSGHSMA